jgi:hypothetical protein
VTYVRSSALFDRAERDLEDRSPALDGARLAIRDLKLIDGTLAQLADTMGLALTDFDTVAAGDT